jgi:glycerol uptake facilitator-like aquaporin
VTLAPVPLGRRLLAEFLGSAFLSALVIGSGIAAQRLSPGQTGLELLENAAATAAGLFTIILMFGPVSGGHFNPVVSFADAALGGLSWRDAGAYLSAQVGGCIGGAVLANLMFSDPAVSISAKHRASGGHFLSEIVATLGLLLVIFALARSGRARTAPAAVGSYIGAAYFFTSSTSFANPAITVGRMFSNTFAGIAPSSAPSFIGAQIVGGVLAMGLIRLLYPGVTPAEAADVIVPHGQNGETGAEDIGSAGGDRTVGDGALHRAGRAGRDGAPVTPEGDWDAPGGDRRQ